MSLRAARPDASSKRTCRRTLIARKRLKEIARNEKDVTVARGKLANEAFVAKAPIEVVEENRERIASGEAAVIKLKEALSRIAE